MDSDYPFDIFKLFLKHIHICFLYFRSTSNLNYKVLDETKTEPEVDYDGLEDVCEGKEKTAEWPSFGIPREVNSFKTLRDLKGDISSLPDHSSNTNIPFECANSDSDTDSDISCYRHVRSSNSSDSSCAYYNPGFVSVNSMSFGSDNGDHYTDARSRQTVLQDDVRNTNYHGNTVRINNRLYQNTELLDHDNYYNCDYDASVPRLHFSENGHSKNGSSNDSLYLASSSYCSLNNKQNEHEHRESSSNDKLFIPPSTEMCSQPSTENDDYLTCVYNV